jgi:uncharacterized membrane protein
LRFVIFSNDNPHGEVWYNTIVIDPYGIIVGIVSLLPLLFLRSKGKFTYFVIAAVFAIAIHGTYLFGPSIIFMLLFSYIVSTIAELVSLKTHFQCFGVTYQYHRNQTYFPSGIRLLGVYPLEVTFSWVIFKYLSFCLAILITQAFALPKLVFILLTPLILVSLDFIIDPVSVNIGKMWEWERGSAYFGIPIQNFIGWYVVDLVATTLFSFISFGKPIAFNILYLLPIIFYGMLLRNSFLLLKLSKSKAVLGSIPVILWTLLGTISLVILYFR